MPTNNEKINFQLEDAIIPEGYLADVGLGYDETRGYGWITQESLGEDNPTPLDLSGVARERELNEDQRLDTLVHMQFGTGNPEPGAWEYAIDNGTYQVTVGVGDPSIIDSTHQINIEGVETIAAFEPTTTEKFATATSTVEVSDGKLTVDAVGGENTKIDYIEFAPVSDLVAQINFQPEEAETPEGYVADSGEKYDEERGYGWIREDSLSEEDPTPWNRSDLGRERERASDQRVDTFINMQYPDRVAGAWEYAIDNGSYEVTVGVGDPSFSNGVYQINVEGVETIAAFEPSNAQRLATATSTVEVTDGKLTVDAVGGENTKIDYIQIAAVDNLEAKINFQPEEAETPEGYVADSGGKYDEEQGYGWIREDSLSEEDPTPWNRSDLGRERERASDQRVDTFINMQYPDRVAGAWEYALPDGTYSVTVSVGDPLRNDSVHQINVEGVALIDSFTPDETEAFELATTTVEVNDGKLTLDAVGGSNTKLNYIEIAATDEAPAPVSNSEIEIENLDGTSYSDRLIFSRIGSLTDPPDNGVHDVAELRISNTGSEPLEIENLEIAGPWEIVDEDTLPEAIAPGEDIDLGVRFIATSGDLVEGSLTIESNDSDEPETVVELAGFWQPDSEVNEPVLPEMVDLFGYDTEIVGLGQKINQQGLVQAIGEEILSSYWQRVDSSQPVTVRQLAAFHTYPARANVFWNEKGSSETELIFTHEGKDGQSLLPRLRDSTEPAEGTFEFDGTFGFQIDAESSNPNNNGQQKDINNGAPGPAGHHVRFWPTRDREGELIEDTYIMTNDYSGINYDYNDNVYLVSNIQPEPQEALYRINAGSDSPYTDTEGNVWSPDTGLFEPSDLAVIEDNGPDEIANTEDDLLYQTYRAKIADSPAQDDRVISYELPVETSEPLNVRLYFAETFWGVGDRPEGKRVFDVRVEGQTIMDDFDIVSDATGTLNAMVIQIGGVRVQDGTLNIEFDPSVDFASISAIEVLQSTT